MSSPFGFKNYCGRCLDRNTPISYRRSPATERRQITAGAGGHGGFEAKVGRGIPCAPWEVEPRPAGRGLPALPKHHGQQPFILGAD